MVRLHYLSQPRKRVKDGLFYVPHEKHIHQNKHGKTLFKFPCAGQGIQFTMVQTKLNVCFFNCCVIISCMIDAYVLADIKGFWNSPIAPQS